MALLHSPAAENGLIGPDFALPDLQGDTVTRDGVMGEHGLVVAFICNHCPYVKAIIDGLVSDAKELQEAGIGVVAIMPNDFRSYPDDAPDKMAAFAKQHGFTFPYLLDEDQSVARAYDAVCTPDFFGLDGNGQLAYRGRLDSRRNPNESDRGQLELRDAMLALGKGENPPEAQMPSMGCSIKWRIS
ncbi:MAG: thioredoxin family protein [Alphaproteobacteria bacterium]|nr:thioredoxin family protein [Alphaproteobacteria bacterium SS10]